MKYLDSFEQHSNKIDEKLFGQDGFFSDKVNPEKAKEIAIKRFKDAVENGKKFDSVSENVEKAKAAQEAKKMQYQTAEDSIYNLIRKNSAIKYIKWDAELGIYVDASAYGANGLGGGTISGGGKGR
jgi:hypothetical protein